MSDIESNQVTVHWDPVSRNSIMGELKEYKVCVCAMVSSFTDKGYCLDIISMFTGGLIEGRDLCEPSDLGESSASGDFIPDLCCSQVYYWRDSSQLRWLRVNRALRSQAFTNRDGEASGVVTGLHPYSNYKMYIVVANNRFEGPPSNNVHFSTPEGGEVPLSKSLDAPGAPS